MKQIDWKEAGERIEQGEEVYLYENTESLILSGVILVGQTYYIPEPKKHPPIDVSYFGKTIRWKSGNMEKVLDRWWVDHWSTVGGSFSPEELADLIDRGEVELLKDKSK